MGRRSRPIIAVVAAAAVVVAQLDRDLLQEHALLVRPVLLAVGDEVAERLLPWLSRRRVRFHVLVAMVVWRARERWAEAVVARPAVKRVKLEFPLQ